MVIREEVSQENYANTAKEKVVISQLIRQWMKNLMSLIGKTKRSITNISKVFAMMLMKKINQ